MLTREQKIDRALDIYIHTPRGSGLGHSALMALGRRLSNAGLNFGEVRYQMETAVRARPRENARAEIAAVIKTLIRTPSCGRAERDASWKGRIGLVPAVSAPQYYTTESSCRRRSGESFRRLAR